MVLSKEGFIMKKLLNLSGFLVRLFFVVLLFTVASSFAEVEPKAESAAGAVSELQEALAKEFTYCDVCYYEEMDRIKVRVAVDGLADLVDEMTAAGYDENFPAWAEYRDGMIAFYDALLAYVQSNYREDLTISFHLVNDKDVNRDFISINGGTGSVFDILKFNSAMRQK